MTPQQIKELAGHRPVPPWVMKLVGEAVAAEREACAKVCDELAEKDKLSNYFKVAANAIRARGQK